MMEENSEAMFKLALRTHGLWSSESDSDSDEGCAEFDYTHEQNKPPPLDPEYIRKNLVVVYPKQPENVWTKRMEACSEEKENLKVDSAPCPISNPATTFEQDVENSSEISERKVTNQKPVITEHDSTNARAVKGEVETSVLDQTSLEIINNSVANKSSVAEISIPQKKKKKKKRKKKKKSEGEKKIEEISLERESQKRVERVGNSVSTEVDAGVTYLENVFVHVPPETKDCEIVISQTIYKETEKIDSDCENNKQNFVSLNSNSVVDNNDRFTEINEIEEENVHEEKITTKSNLYGNPQEKTNCKKELSPTDQINSIKKKKKVKFVPIDLGKLSTTPQTIKNTPSQQKNLEGVVKKEILHHNNMSTMDNNVNSNQQLALLPLVIETNTEFYRNVPQVNTNLVNGVNDITKITATKQKNSFEEKIILKLAAVYESTNLQDQINDSSKEPSSAKTEANCKKKNKTKFVPSNLLDETISTIPPVSHLTQNSSCQELSFEKTASGTKIQLEPCTVLNKTLPTITSEAEFSHTRQRMSNETRTEKKCDNQGLSPHLPHSGDIDKILEISDFGQKNIHPTGVCVPFRTFNEKIKKQETIFLNGLNYQQNSITNNREGTSRSDNELSLVPGVKKKKKKKGKVSRSKPNHSEIDISVFCFLQFGFPCNLDFGTRLEFLNQYNSCCVDFSTFNGNIKELEDKAYQKKDPFYENSIISAFAIFDHIFRYRENTLWTELNYFETIQYGLEIYLYSGSISEEHNFNELDSYEEMYSDFISNTGGLESSYKVMKRISVLVQPCHDYSDCLLRKDAETDQCLRKDFMYNESTKDTRNQRDTLTENNEEEMLHFTLETEETNDDSVGRRDNIILVKADKTVTDTSDNYEISYVSEKYPDNELRKPLSDPMKNEINQNTIRTAIETPKVPYPFTVIVHLIFFCVFLHLMISFMNWVIENCLTLTLFFMCIIILNIAN